MTRSYRAEHSGGWRRATRASLMLITSAQHIVYFHPRGAYVIEGSSVVPDDYITSHPDILGGKPVIAGTRISVDLVLERLGEGRSIDEILAEYPHLKHEQVVAAIEYARARLAGSPAAAE